MSKDTKADKGGATELTEEQIAGTSLPPSHPPSLKPSLLFLLSLLTLSLICLMPFICIRVQGGLFPV